MTSLLIVFVKNWNCCHKIYQVRSEKREELTEDHYHSNITGGTTRKVPAGRQHETKNKEKLQTLPNIPAGEQFCPSQVASQEENNKTFCYKDSKRAVSVEAADTGRVPVPLTTQALSEERWQQCYVSFEN